MSWSLQDLILATQGQLIGADSAQQVQFNSVSTDSRTLIKGALYVALVGEQFDGHQFIAQAVAQGAVAILSSEACDTSVPLVQVGDTRLALGQFGAWHRMQMPIKRLVAITGSNGKTTTKTLLAHLLQTQAPTWATQGNLNNDLGVPRTLLQITPKHHYAVIEMGANHQHEIAYLTGLAKPDLALITNAAGAHLEGFGSLDGVIQAKGEIFEGLGPEGLAFLNCDSPGFEQWQKKCLGLQQKVITFGQSDMAEVRLLNYQLHKGRAVFEVEFDQQITVFEMRLLGLHNAQNATAVIAVAWQLGLTRQAMVDGLASFMGVDGRLQPHDLSHGVLLDDSYNANPESVKAGIATLMSFEGIGCVCLGAMAELGPDAQQQHDEIARFAKQQGVKALLLYGELTRSMVVEFGEGAHWFATHAELADHAQKLLQQQQVNNILVKGSRSAGMERVSHAILNP